MGSLEHQLIAVLCADVKDSSLLMQRDEEGTIRRLNDYRRLFDQSIVGHRGRITSTAGDSVVAEFSSVQDAVSCAVHVQQVLSEQNQALTAVQRLYFRIGIHMCDVIRKEQTILGDGVNIAARIEGIAEPGGISLSGSVYDSVKHKLPLRYVYQGEQALKNIIEPVKVYKVLLGSSDPDPHAGPHTEQASKAGGRMKFLVGLAAVLAVAIVLGLAYRLRPVQQSQLMRFTVSFQDQVRYSVGEDFLRSASISPDGLRIVFTGSDQTTGAVRLYIRPIESVQATPIQGSEYGTEPFWSPDSKAVGFYANGKVMLANLEGGRPREIADAISTGGASWNDRGQILISLQNPGPLVLIPAAGGTPTPVTALDPSQEIDHDWPQFLDDGVHFMYMSRGRTAAGNKVFVGSLKSPNRTLLLEGVPAFAYAPPDRVIFLRGSILLAQAFNTERFDLVGQPVALADNALPPFSASRTGALTYRTVPTTPSPLIWLGTDGSVIGDALPPGYYVDPQISPDGTQVAFGSRESPEDTWDVSILDLGSGATRKLTLYAGNDRAPVWSPDGKAIVYLSFRPDAPGLYRKNANGVGAEELILPSKGVVWPYQWTRDHLFYFEGISGANDIWMMSTNDLGERTPLIQTPFNDVDGTLSPDGNWLAYTSNETGRWELYLTTFPPSSTKLPITTQGGCDPVWNVDGKELYYIKPSSAELLAIPVTRGDPPVFGTPRRIYSGPLEYPSAHSIDVDPKGDRLLVASSFSVHGDLTVLVNWQSLTMD